MRKVHPLLLNLVALATTTSLSLEARDQSTEKNHEKARLAKADAAKAEAKTSKK